MDENEIDSDAQDPNIEAEEGGEEKGKGAQARINELTAKSKDFERKLEEANARNLALEAARLVEGNRQQQAAPVVDEFPDADPTVKEMLKRQERQFNQRFNALQNEYEGRFMAQEAAVIVQNAGGDEKVQSQAKMYAAELRKKGLPVNSEEAAVFAIGKAVLAGTYTPAQGQPAPVVAQRRGAPPMGNVRGPNLAVPVQASEKPLPQNFDSLTHDQQLAILEKRGAGDKPI